jgi:hypothetical protein
MPLGELREALQEKEPRVRVTAAEQIFDRAYGMPASGADVTLWHEVDWATAHLEALTELARRRAPTMEPETPTNN